MAAVSGHSVPGIFLQVLIQNKMRSVPHVGIKGSKNMTGLHNIMLSNTSTNFDDSLDRKINNYVLLLNLF